MPLLALLGIGVILLLVFGPQWWIRRTLRKYAEPADRYSGSGADLARHLLDESGLHEVKVERTADNGDHYDPTDRAVRLSPLCFDGRSLTAITVAAHEVGHALQHRDRDAMLLLRGRLAGVFVRGQKLALIFIVAAPLVAVFTRSGALMWLLVIAAFSIQLLGTIMQFVTLPVEWDASFGRALPLLKRLEILHPSDHQHARSLLRAAAFTYVAGSLFSLLLLVRWIR
jgi:hypothetical protein